MSTIQKTAALAPDEPSLDNDGEPLEREAPDELNTDREPERLDELDDDRELGRKDDPDDEDREPLE
jgi:hypothetical protein